MRTLQPFRCISRSAIRYLAAGVFVLCCAWPAAPKAGAQTLLEMEAAQGVQSNLNAQQVGPSQGGGFNPIQRAQDAAAATGTPAGTGFAPPPPAAPTGFAPQTPGGAFPAAPFGAPPITGIGGQPGFGGIPGIPVLAEPRVAVIAGTRVYDAVTRHLLDDAVQRFVPESERENYFDDGTHGDVEANDGTYTLAEENSEFVSQTNQRIKEQLVQALLKAEQMSPLEFFGYTLMSTERLNSVSRTRAWKLIPDPSGGPGSVLAEVPIDRPLEVPNFREKQSEQNSRIRDNWSDRFLVEFRKNKDSLTSEFYPMHIPQPPVPPSTAPPVGWTPFSSALVPQDPAAQQLGPNGMPLQTDFNRFGQAPATPGNNPINQGFGPTGTYYDASRLGGR